MIDLKLKCKCTFGEETLSVRERFADEDICAYMNFIQQMVAEWHSSRLCSAPALQYLKIPVDDNSPIGVVAR